MHSRRLLALVVPVVLGSVLPAPVLAAPPAPIPPPRTEIEAAAQALVQPIVRRHVVRNPAGRYDVWLVSELGFEAAIEAARRAISSKRPLFKNLRLERWTWVEAERTYLLDLVGASQPYRLRLTRHLQGSLLEAEDAGEAEDAPRWSPVYRPLPQLLPHGPAR